MITMFLGTDYVATTQTFILSHLVSMIYLYIACILMTSDDNNKLGRFFKPLSKLVLPPTSNYQRELNEKWPKFARVSKLIKMIE